MITHYAQASYVLGYRHATARITVTGGHITADYRLNGRQVCPYFVAPWWNEARLDPQDGITQVLRGDFFCLPFGANADPYGGVKYPVHGATANDCWELVGEEGGAEAPRLHLRLPAADSAPGSRAVVDRRIGVSEGSPVMYCEHLISGWSGSAPGGHHAVLQFPPVPGAGLVDMSEPVTGFTVPEPIENPADRGYSLLQPGQEITDRRRVRTVHGDSVDLTRYPTPFGYEDVAMFVSDPKLEFCYSAASFPGEGYLFFQLKDPNVLAETLMWMSNGGRHYAPWNGRLRGVLGLEEVTTYFAYGIKQSVEPNPVQQRGFPTALRFDPKRPTAVRLISGVAPIPSGFAGVQDVHRKDDSTILIEGRGGERIELAARVDFLRKGF